MYSIKLLTQTWRKMNIEERKVLADEMALVNELVSLIHELIKEAFPDDKTWAIAHFDLCLDAFSGQRIIPSVESFKMHIELFNENRRTGAV